MALASISLSASRWAIHLSLVISVVALGAFTLPERASAQGVLIVEGHDQPVPLPRPHIRPRPQPPVSYKIKEFSIQARIEDQIARTQVTQSFVNTGSRQMEVSFVFPLPYDGAIDRLTFMVDGQEYEAKLLPADEARSIYEGYIRRNKDPALLEWIGHGMFKTSVFPIPPGAERKVTMRYSQVLRRDRQMTDYLFPLSTAKYSSKPIEKLAFDVSIKSEGKIKSVYSPSHTVNIERNGDHQAKVSFVAENAIPISDFRLFYDTSDSAVGASMLSYWPEGQDQGYFLLLASPEIERATVEVPRKTVILVVDRSGSMSGKKIEQAREALTFVLNNLNPNDLFNVIAYDSEIEVFKPELQKYSDESREEALRFVSDIYAGGSTNIDGALATALDMIQDEATPNYVVFLTDGRPTAGETDEMKIVENTKTKNTNTARLINLGVGFDVNSRLLDRLSRANRGQSEYVRPNDDLETYVARIYSRISSPVMTNLDVSFELDEVADATVNPVNRLYPNPLPDLFQGEQLVIAGRYRSSGAAKIKVAGRVGDQIRTLDFGADFAATSATANYAFVEKLWAARRIGEIIDELDLVGQNEELVKELIELSTKHGILTQYTSFLADDQAGGVPVASDMPALRMAQDELDHLSIASGRQGFEQRLDKKTFQEAERVQGGGFAPAGANRSRGIGGGGADASDATARYSAFGGVTMRDADTGEQKFVEGVQVVGNETLYRRGNLWIASNASGIDPVQDAEQITDVERFSEAYFALVAANSASENAILASQAEDVELVIRLRDTIYRIK